MIDIDELIRYLDTDLSLDTLNEMDIGDLARLNKLLYHWERITDRTIAVRRSLNKDEETE